MWTSIISFLKPSWLVVAGWLAALASVAGLLLSVRRGGENAVKNQDLQKTLNEVKVSEETRTEVNSLSDSQLDKLHDEWTR